MVDTDKIAKLEERVRTIMARPTFGSTPAWHQEVAELRVQIEEIRSGKTPAVRPYENPALVKAANPQAAVVVAGHDAHDAGHHEEPNYMAVFFALTVLTLVELGLSPVFKMRGMVLALGLSFFASLKALAVAYYYMHLKWESKGMKLLLILPISLIVVLFVLVIPDAVSKFQSVMQ